MAYTHQLFISSTLYTPPLKLASTKHLTLNALSSSSQESILETITNSNSNSNCLPCVRSYENDMARLSLNGAVSLDQALTAASSDGGATARQHLDAGLSTMVVEALFPGPTDAHSTVSTRLFLPAKKVKEKARKLRASLPDDILSSTTSNDILAMTFRQVVVQKLWNFELEVFLPGSQRNMNDLGSPREVSSSFSLSTSDEKAISRLGEAICILSLESTQIDFFQGSSSRKSSNRRLFNWVSKSKKFSSKDSSVIIHGFEDEIVENAKSLLEKFNMVRAKYKMKNKKEMKSAWTPLMKSKLEKIGGSEFSVWIMEYVPAYKLVIDVDRLTGLKLEGWKNTIGNSWEVFLTHSQMVGLANVLDIYFEDVYTFPSKQLSCDVIRTPKKLTKNKEGFSLFGFLRTTLITATLLVSLGVLVKLYLPNLSISKRRYPRESYVLPSLENDEQIQPWELDASELNDYCSTIVKKIRDFYGWKGEVEFEPSVGAWIGEFPVYLRHGFDPDLSSQDDIDITKQELGSSVPEIASYQVVLVPEGKVVGFQPTSLVAVNHWSSNPIAKELHGGKDLSPGLLEPGLKIGKPEKVIVLELLMSLNQDNPFALARHVK